jgi:hypothetical protein
VAHRFSLTTQTTIQLAVSLTRGSRTMALTAFDRVFNQLLSDLAGSGKQLDMVTRSEGQISLRDTQDNTEFRINIDIMELPPT